MAAEEAAVATTASAWAADEDEVAEEELRLLEAMTAVSTSMQQVRRPHVLAGGVEDEALGLTGHGRRAV
jgi:PHD/YefM family antitoxin component YafN of YafNO toxin-antitoxin module